jgi:hypothetical protein
MANPSEIVGHHAVGADGEQVDDHEPGVVAVETGVSESAVSAA